MPHTGVEEKTPWRNVPAAVKVETARLSARAIQSDAHVGGRPV